MNRSRFTFIALICLLFGSLFISRAQAFDISLTNFPAQNPFVDTLRYSLVKMTNPKFYFAGKKRKIKMLLGQEKTKLGYKVWMQKDPAPMVVLLPGLGANYVDTGPAAIGEFIYNQGFSVILVSSAFNWEFVINASTVGAPGYTPQDAQDIYSSLQLILQDVKNKYGDDRITETILTGYSLGGLHTSFIADIDSREQKINFDRFVAISPPVNVMHAMLMLDSLYSQWQEWSEEQLEEKKNRAVKLYESTSENGVQDESELSVTSEEAQFAIGLLYRINLNEVIKAIHAKRDMGILSRPFSTLSRQKLEREIERYGYYNYALTFVKHVNSNVWTDSLPLKELNFQASLPAIQKTLMFNPKLTVLHSDNDWLVTDYDRQWLRKVMKDRLVMLDHGGHLGYFYRPDAQKIIVGLLRGEMPDESQLAAQSSISSPVVVSTSQSVVRIPDQEIVEQTSQEETQSATAVNTSTMQSYQTNDTMVFDMSGSASFQSAPTNETVEIQPEAEESETETVEIQPEAEESETESLEPFTITNDPVVEQTKDIIIHESIIITPTTPKKSSSTPDDPDQKATEKNDIRRDITIEYRD